MNPSEQTELRACSVEVLGAVFDGQRPPNSPLVTTERRGSGEQEPRRAPI